MLTPKLTLARALHGKSSQHLHPTSSLHSTPMMWNGGTQPCDDVVSHISISASSRKRIEQPWGWLDTWLHHIGYLISRAVKPYLLLMFLEILNRCHLPKETKLLQPGTFYVGMTTVPIIPLQKWHTGLEIWIVKVCGERNSSFYSPPTPIMLVHGYRCEGHVLIFFLLLTVIALARDSSNYLHFTWLNFT